MVKKEREKEGGESNSLHASVEKHVREKHAASFRAHLSVLSRGRSVWRNPRQGENVDSFSKRYKQSILDLISAAFFFYIYENELHLRIKGLS